MEDFKKKGDPKAIISAIVAFLNTLVVVVGVDVGKVIVEFEKICSKGETESESSDEEESNDSAQCACQADKDRHPGAAQPGVTRRVTARYARIIGPKPDGEDLHLRGI